MSDINEGLKRCRETPGAILVDLRDEEDYREGHIPGAVNVLLQNLREAAEEMAEMDTPLFLYCYGGMRSFQAEALLQAMGYQNALSIGGIDRYKGELEEE